jgi:translation initiation factor IF-2
MEGGEAAPEAKPEAGREGEAPGAAEAEAEAAETALEAPETAETAPAPAGESPAAAPGAGAAPAVPSERKELIPTRKKKPKDGFKAVVIAMPEEVEPAKPVVTPARPSPIRPSARELEKEEAQSGPRRKGKKLIYDRRREGPTIGGDRDVVRAGKPKKKKMRGQGEPELPAAPSQRRTVRIEETITVGDMAAQMAIKSSLLLKRLVEQGVMATLNDTLDFDTAAIIATDLGYEVENTAFDPSEYLKQEEDKAEDLRLRPPVVTIMGHVDHGKTSLLDRIQATDIAAGEAGGITQKIGAYLVETEKGRVTFVDTPGHEAFTAMRARGARVTDIVLLVVAADDGVMPQTIEAINHAKAANVPIIVAVNKMDKPEADPDRIRREVSDQGLLPEEWGGSTIFVNVSARTGQGIKDLLDMLVLQAEVLDLKANPDKRARGTIIESRLEKGRGPVASVIIQEGTLRIGDAVVAGTATGKVRALIDHRGKPLSSVGPSQPAELIGLDKVPQASEMLYCLEDEKSGKVVSDHRDKKDREERLAKVKRPTFEQLLNRMATAERKSLQVVLKGDSQGSLEAIRQGMSQIASEKVNLQIIHSGVGMITESDVNLAMTSDGLILGFNVRPDVKARAQADAQGVEILTFDLIHELLDKTKALMEGKLEMREEKVYLGKAEVRQVFTVSRVGKIAGCMVLDGKVIRSGVVRVLRGGEEKHSGRLSSLKRFKEDVREVLQGFECGIGIEGFSDVAEGDIIESYEIQKVAATL